MKLDSTKIISFLSSDGLLSRNLKRFQFRAAQQQMLSNVIDAYNNRQVALIEAGTGTGKTIAYLTPALLWAQQNQERTVISTNTITLQEQLVKKDIPNLCKALGVNVQAILVKGMNNYLCLRKLADTLQESTEVISAELEELHQIVSWKQKTVEGSKSDLPFTPSGALWEKVNAESDTCTNTLCPHFSECYFFKARQKANDAQILVVNHHLLFADLAVRAETDNYKEQSVLPYYKNVIIDEAHNIEDIATDYFASKVSHFGMMRILSKLTAENKGKNVGKLSVLKHKLSKHCKDPNDSTFRSIIQRITIDLPTQRLAIQTALNSTFQHFTGVGASRQFEEQEEEKKLRLRPEHTKELVWQEIITPGINEILQLTKKYTETIHSLKNDVNNFTGKEEEFKPLFLEIQAYAARLELACETLYSFSTSSDYTYTVRWIESQKRNSGTNVHLIKAHLDVAPLMVNCLFEPFETIVLCSATLATDRHFKFLKDRLGLTPQHIQREITENIYDSPFDYKKQALLVVPKDIPAPNEPSFLERAIAQIFLAIQASKGNTFVLFTSYQMLQSCYEALAPQLIEKGYHLFKQGQQNRTLILEEFQLKEGSILFGTDSFWEGVDIAGDALRCVVIVKLPFKVPTEPIIQARTEAIAARGGNPFVEYSVPHAIVKFKQGFGRLIRNKNDRGCIICLDNRLFTKQYGKLFLNSLPNCDHLYEPGKHLLSAMEEFYRKTYYLVQK